MTPAEQLQQARAEEARAKHDVDHPRPDDDLVELAERHETARLALVRATWRTLPQEVTTYAQTLWDYHRLDHALRPVDVGIGLGSHDIGVAEHTAKLYDLGMFPRVVFTGANAPTTADRFPFGEGAHYRRKAIELGVPDVAILVEASARNTGENITRTRALLAAAEIPARSVMLISRPYQQRRAYATCRKLWPEVDVICSAQDLLLEDYLAEIGPDRVLNMLVGDTQRIEVYPAKGFAIPQEMPDHVREAYTRLVQVGYTSRLVAA